MYVCIDVPAGAVVPAGEVLDPEVLDPDDVPQHCLYAVE